MFTGSITIKRGFKFHIIPHLLRFVKKTTRATYLSLYTYIHTSIYIGGVYICLCMNEILMKFRVAFTTSTHDQAAPTHLIFHINCFHLIYFLWYEIPLASCHYIYVCIQDLYYRQQIVPDN